MRVIAGSAKRMNLVSLEGIETMPTTDRVKESIFNIIQFDIEGRRVLDLFAGSGQLGIEALSRGAESAVFVDQNAAAVKIIRQNLEKTKLLQLSQVFQMGYEQFLRTCRNQFELIFLDPPYSSKMLQNSLKMISEFDILVMRGIIVCERSVDREFSIDMEDYDIRDYKYGKTVISIITKP